MQAALRAKAPIRVTAAKMVVPEEAMAWKARFRVEEPIRAKVAAMAVRCAKEPIHAMAAATIRGVRPDAMAAGHFCEAFHCVMAADRTGAEFPSAKDDPHHCSAKNAASLLNQRTNPLKARCVQFPASCESEPEFVRRFYIRFRAAVGQGEQSAHPEFESAAQNSRRHFAASCCVPAKLCFGCRDSAIRRASVANQFQPHHFDSEQQSGRNSEPGDVRSRVIPIAGRFLRVRLSIHESTQPAWA